MLGYLFPRFATRSSPRPESRGRHQRSQLRAYEAPPEWSLHTRRVKAFLWLFPSGPVAIAIGINAFLGLRKPEVEALLPDDYDAKQARIRIHRNTKTGNDEWLPVVAPLAALLSDGWEQIKLSHARWEIGRKIKGTSLAWKGFYAFRRGLATNLCFG